MCRTKTQASSILSNFSILEAIFAVSMFPSNEKLLKYMSVFESSTTLKKARINIVNTQLKVKYYSFGNG